MARRIQRFEVLAQLGSGGMGQVYRARDPELERDVAIKVLTAATAPRELSAHDTLDLRNGEPGARDDLLREARMMARLSHPNVLPVYEVGLSDGAVFLVMEHIDGTDLSAWLAQPRATRATIDVFLQAARGLAAAHQRGIVHRDIKPENILIGRDGRVRLADFGLSKLTTRSTSSMIHVEDGRGTPRYMAPELWRGYPATPRADVYALCLALVEALGGEDAATRDRVLRERGVRPRLRQVLARGLADDPAARPPLGHLIDALEGRPPRWRTWVVAGAAALAVGAALAIGAIPATQPAGAANQTPPCDPDPAVFAARADPGRFAAVKQKLLDQAPAKFRDVAQRIAGDLETQRQTIDQRMAGACKAMRDRALTWDQYRIRASCLQRRSFELGAVIDMMFETSSNLLTARDRADYAQPPAGCDAMVAPPIAGDPTAVERLWRRYIRTRVDTAPKQGAARIAELTAVAAAADALGETELVARSTRWLGLEQRNTDLALADDTAQRAYRMALELKETTFTAQLLIDRAVIANLRDDATAAFSYAQLARDLADKPTTVPRVRARIYLQLGSSSSTRGDTRAAVAYLRRGMAIVKDHQLTGGAYDLDIRRTLLTSLSIADVLPPGTLELATETMELARALVGERDERYGVAVDVLAEILEVAEDYHRAIPARRKALEILSAVLPADAAYLPHVRVSLAYELYMIGDLPGMQRELAADAASGARPPRHHWVNQGLVALSVFERGDFDEGLALIGRAQEEAISAYGKSHPNTYLLRGWAVEIELEGRRLDEAARDIAGMADGYRTTPDGSQLRMLRLRGTLAAELAIARGKPRDAEVAAREALRAAAELHATERDRARFHAALGASLVAQRRWAEARTELEAALAILTKVEARRDHIAAVEIKLAVAESGLGNRAAALARARRARAVLDKYPGRLRARGEADGLLGRPGTR